MPDLQTDTTLIHQVAEAIDTDGTLRWPQLSRECHCLTHRRPSGRHPFFQDTRHRVPDVTLEKVLDLCQSGISIFGFVNPDGEGNMWGVWTRASNSRGKTPLEAACAALLKSVNTRPSANTNAHRTV